MSGRQLIGLGLCRRLNTETGLRIGVAASVKVGRIKIILSCDANQGEQRVPPRISELLPFGVAQRSR